MSTAKGVAKECNKLLSKGQKREQDVYDVYDAGDFPRISIIVP